MLFILRADSGNEEFKFETVDISQIISTVFQNMKPYAAERKVTLDVNNQNNSGYTDGIVKVREQRKRQGLQKAHKVRTTAGYRKTEIPTGIFVTGDSNKLKQAFYNILKNAVDYSKPSGKVQLRLLKQPKTVQIEITDEGTGIPVEEIAFVFERFYRSSNNSGLYSDGSGLGLAITKEIIIKHKGEIKIESSLGNWTKVTINLPY